MKKYKNRQFSLFQSLFIQVNYFYEVNRLAEEMEQVGFQSLFIQVNYFYAKIYKLLKLLDKKFQSLFIQVNYFYWSGAGACNWSQSMFQSLFIQVNYFYIVIDIIQNAYIMGCFNPFLFRSIISTRFIQGTDWRGLYVSIPFYSGQLFLQEERKQITINGYKVSIPFYSGQLFLRYI